MTAGVSKYLHVIAIGFQNTFVYRWNFLVRVLFSLIPLMGTFYLWGAVFSDPSATVGGYAFREMISYFLTLVLLDSLASPTEDDFQIAGEIRDGLINQFLLKPMDYLAYRFSLFWSYRLIYTATTILPVLAVLWFMRDYLVLPGSAAVWIAALLATLLSAALQFLMAYCSAMMAFWILDVSAPIFIIYSIEYLAGGHMFPLDLLPPSLCRLMMLTPFPYEYWFPLGVFLQRMPAEEMARGFGMQFLWCLLFLGLARWLWSRGIRHYTAVGG
ncbi:MAG: ABC-2 family transporter protein [Verrucomicrobia bacterium]|nr:ABC-2 family transporter protein [Verrucomicrobiota bacterium]